MIELKNCMKKYKKGKVGIENVNICLPKNGFIGIYGKSGSGKSTLINCLGGLDKFTSGEIYLDNVEITSSETRLDDKYLKYSLDIDSAKGTAKYLTTLGPDGERLLDQGTLKNSEKKDYVLRIWPTVEVDGDFGGQVWKGKLRITGDQLT